MWHNYFYNIQTKYSMRVSRKEPLVIRLDGKDTAKNKNISLIDNYENSFCDALKKSAKYFSKRYKCMAFLGSDEISFIFKDPSIVINDLGSDKSNYSNEIISVFSQYFFDHFNNFNKNNKVFWHGKCFTIHENKINSYIKYRSKLIENAMTTYFLIKNKSYEGGMSLEDRNAMCSKIPEGEKLNDIKNGQLYLEGECIDLNEFLLGNVKKIIEEEQRNIVIDILDF